MFFIPLIITCVLAKFQISLYIESLCPDTTRFIQTSLKKVAATPQLLDLVEFKFIPFGKANIELNKEETTFRCQHGSLECYGNMLQACAFQMLGQQQSLDFITCFQSGRKRSPEELNQQLTTCLPDFQQQVLDCVKGTEGVRLMAINAEETLALQPPLNYVPWITVDGQFDQKNHAQIEKNLMLWICRQPNQQKVDVCDQYNN